jgi:hypothetical protein
VRLIRGPEWSGRFSAALFSFDAPQILYRFRTKRGNSNDKSAEDRKHQHKVTGPEIGWLWVIARDGVRHQGYVDDGWKDTVLIMPGERIRILVDFDDYTGLFIYHYHNLEHEDMDMMRNYYVS